MLLQIIIKDWKKYIIKTICLIKEIIDEGHEIACHTNNHIPLDKQTPSEFREDLEKNISLLINAGAKEIKGFRAPIFSLTEKTQWVYEILDELGFIYSSSVLPAKNPLYGWEDFGKQPKIYKNNIIEIPITVAKFGGLTIPTSGGIYYRVMPFFIIKKMIDKNEKNLPLVGYFHPYDIDTEQEKFMHSGINNNKFYNWLMYYNRKNVFKRLDYLIANGYKICTYPNFVKSELSH